MSSSRRPSEAASEAASPTDTRTQGRFDAASGNTTARDFGLSESYQSTDTVRRRPETATYGTMQSPTPASSSQPFFSSEGAGGLAPQAGSGSGGRASISRSPMLGPERGRSRPRKPHMARRASSNAQAPHRGEIFSVDDALDEVEADHAEAEQRAHPGSHSTTGRRRTTAAPPALSRVHSRQEDHDDNNNGGGGEPTPRPGSSRGNISLEYAVAEDGGADDADARTVTSAGPGGEEDALLAAAEDSIIDDLLDVDEGGGGEGGEHHHHHHGDDELDEGELSDAESFTLKDRQQAINETHPFGIRIWKPALYKKDRSVQKTAEGDIHSSPGGHVSNWLFIFNIMWTLCFGWWLALIAFVGAVACFLSAAPAPSARQYGRVLWGLAGYLFYPFGKFIRLEQQEAYLDEDQGEGRSISEYEQWQSGDLEYGRLFFGPERNRSIIGRSRRSIDSEPSETDSLLGRAARHGRGGSGSGVSGDDDSGLPAPMKRRLFGRGKWNVGRVIFFLVFYLLLTPSLFIVSGICWLLVFWIPMGKVTMLLFDHLRRHPLALNFGSDIAKARAGAAPSSIIVCTYRAVGLKYWKYTVDGTNIFLINLMAVVLFVVADWLILDGVFHMENFLTSPGFLFVAGLFSIIPLAYFIGQAVASISAQSSMGLGAAINAFFSTIVEVFLYCVALSQGKGQLVEGSIVGSIFAGILFLPGISMCCGAIKRKTQRFNARSAGVTSTMLLFAVIGAFGPTLFYQIYGTHELNCMECVSTVGSGSGGDPDHPPQSRDCRRCFFSQTPALDDRFYLEAVRPYCYMAAAMLFLSYVIGLWFTLRTHAAVIWYTEADEKKHEETHHAGGGAGAIQNTPRPSAMGSLGVSGMTPALGDSSGTDIRDSHVYKRILGHSLRQVGLAPQDSVGAGAISPGTVIGPGGGGSVRGSNGLAATTPHLVPPKAGAGGGSLGYSSHHGSSGGGGVHIPGLSAAENDHVAHQVAEIAATAASVAVMPHGPRATSRSNAAAASHSHHAAAASAVSPFPGVSGHAAASRPGPPTRTATFAELDIPGASAGAGGGGGGGHSGGHDAPNWSRLKSSIILMGATLLYAVIAEILVDSVDVVLDGFAIDEKFLGITLFALVPNTTEFLNAISFAMNGNIALSMEIGSAYALQVCLLQIPALVLFSALYSPQAGAPVDPGVGHYTFSLLFPQWDMVVVILCVFLLSYMYGEGKSNYFKGSILLLSYLVVVIGFYYSGYTEESSVMGMGASRFDRIGTDGQYVSYGAQSFKTVGRGRSGVAF